MVEACDTVECVVHDFVVYGHDLTKLIIIDIFESHIVHIVHENMLHVFDVLCLISPYLISYPPKVPSYLVGHSAYPLHFLLPMVL